MNERSWYRLMLCAFMLCFACLLVTGADRLIGSRETAVSLMENPPAAAYACSIRTQSEETGPLVRREYEAQRRELHVHIGRSVPGAAAAKIACDSNGNILAGCSYMRAVYQAFALGDGFA